MGRQNAAALEFDPKPSEAAFSTVFFTVASDRKLLVTSYPMWLIRMSVRMYVPILVILG